MKRKTIKPIDWQALAIKLLSEISAQIEKTNNLEKLVAAYKDKYGDAIRAEALEEAAKVCDDYDMDHIVGQQLAAAIRELK
jgi:hypothetical protein